MPDRWEIPSGIADRVVHMSQDSDGTVWACAAYDHGPLCRRCQRCDETTLMLLVQVTEGLMDVKAGPEGELLFRLTEAGQARARDLIEHDPESQALHDRFVVNEMEQRLGDDPGEETERPT